MILRVPVLVGDVAAWVRKAAVAINQIIDTLNQPVTAVAADLPVYPDNATAKAAGLVAGQLYRNAPASLNASTPLQVVY